MPTGASQFDAVPDGAAIGEHRLAFPVCWQASI